MPTRWTTLPNHPWLGQISESLFVQSFPKFLTDVELEAFLVAAERLILERRAPFAWIVDVGGLFHATAKQRRMFAEFEDRVKEHDALYCAGAAIYAPNAFTRGVVTAVFWLSSPSYPYRVVETLDDAEQFARERLAERGDDTVKA